MWFYWYILFLLCRCGSVQPGDKLLCINDIRTENLSIDEAVTLLKGDDEIIKLKLKREDPCTGEYYEESNSVFRTFMKG